MGRERPCGANVHIARYKKLIAESEGDPSRDARENLASLLPTPLLSICMALV